MPVLSALATRFPRVLTTAYLLFSTACGQLDVPAPQSVPPTPAPLPSPSATDSRLALPPLSPAQLQWLGQQIFANECNRQLRCLTHWNEGENFPSLGIGHFIWYRSGQEEAFEETFPALLGFLQASGVRLPDWLGDPASAASADNPWPDRASFLEASDRQDERMGELGRLLQSTMDLQAQFIVQRLDKTLTDIVDSFPPAQQGSVREAVLELAGSNAPMGWYALIDYLHFKGSGLKPSERYQQQGWGLKQVLAGMDRGAVSLESFVAAATVVLTERVANAPAERNEQRWLEGWINRLHTYLATPESLH